MGKITPRVLHENRAVRNIRKDLPWATTGERAIETTEIDLSHVGAERVVLVGTLGTPLIDTDGPRAVNQAQTLIFSKKSQEGVEFFAIWPASSSTPTPPAQGDRLAAASSRAASMRNAYTKDTPIASAMSSPPMTVLRERRLHHPRLEVMAGTTGRKSGECRCSPVIRVASC